MNKGNAVVLLSGGQDSCTCLYWALQKGNFDKVYALSIHYGQKHAAELASAEKVAELAGVPLDNINVGNILRSTSPLVSETELGKYEDAKELPGGVEPTFVPGRNILFLTLAMNYAESVGAKNIVTGVCEEDFGGYYDCRRVFINNMEKALSQGFHGEESSVRIHTPLMNINKGDTVKLAQELEGCMEALGYTHTCYDGQRPPCGSCHACILRQRGFAEAGVPDPIFATEFNIEMVIK